MKVRYGASLAIAGLFLSSAALAGDPYANVMNSMQSKSTTIAAALVPVAFGVFWKLFLIQFTLNNYSAVKAAYQSGEFLNWKLITSIMWAGFVVYLITHNIDILTAIHNGFMQLASTASGGVPMEPGAIMSAGIDLQNNMVASFNTSTGADKGLVDALKNFLPALMLMFACTMILLAFFLISVAVAIAKLEFYMLIATAPIAFALGGLDALKNSAISPLQAMLSIGFRLLILGAIIGMVDGMIPQWDQSFQNIQVNDWTPIWESVFGAALAAVAAFSAGKIASALATGQSNLTGNDGLFAGMQMLNTAANTMTMMNTATQLMLDGMQKGGKLGAAGLGAGKSAVENLFGGGRGTISEAALNRDSLGGMPGGTGGGSGKPSAAEAARANAEFLGGFAGSGMVPVDPDSNGGSSAGNASTAGIGGSGQPSVNNNQNYDGQQKHDGQQKPSKFATLGKAGIDQFSALQGNDQSSVHVQIDAHRGGAE